MRHQRQIEALKELIAALEEAEQQGKDTAIFAVLAIDLGRVGDDQGAGVHNRWVAPDDGAKHVLDAALRGAALLVRDALHERRGTSTQANRAHFN